MLLPTPKKRPGLLERGWIALWNRTPSDFRRMSLLSSLYARFAECHEDDKDRLNQVNQAFNLTRDVRCMQFSVFIAPYVWSHILPIHRIDGERLDVYIGRVLKNTPCWLKYGEDEVLREDINHLMRYCIDEQCPLPT
ncbi:hypothetical protein D3C87_1680110 [compost metagenome]